MNNNFCNSILIFFLQQINLYNKPEITTGKTLSYTDCLQNLLKQFLYNKWLLSELILTNYQLKFTGPFNMFSITTHTQDSSDKKLVYIITVTALVEFTRLALSRHVNVMGSPLYCRLHWASITRLQSTNASRLGNTTISGRPIHNAQ